MRRYSSAELWGLRSAGVVRLFGLPLSGLLVLSGDW